jgi:predicted DNA-binding protein
MKRTTVKVSEDLDARLRHEAERRGITVSEMTREALEAYLRPASDRRLSFESLGRSGAGDIASRIEEILAEEWGGRRTR